MRKIVNCPLALMLVVLAACGSPHPQTTSTPASAGSTDSSPYFAVTADMLLRVADLASLPGTWCCDLGTPIAGGPRNSGLAECTEGKVGSLGDDFVSDEPQAPGTGVNDFGKREFAETLFEFLTSRDASQCMSAERQRMTKLGGEYTPLSFPTLGDEAVAVTDQAITSIPKARLHLVLVRRGNILLLIGGAADDRTLSYVTVALAKVDRVLASATPASPLTTTSTP